VFDVDAEFLGQVTEDREDDARRDDRRDEVQRGNDGCVNVNLESEQCTELLTQPFTNILKTHSKQNFRISETQL